jgi:hypothetical protein
MSNTSVASTSVWSTIANGADRPLFDKSGDVPDVSGALESYFQPMVCEPVGKFTQGFQVVERGNPINFRGTVQPFTDRSLLLKPEGQRAWSWLLIHADPSLKLNVDDVIIFKGKQTRVMSMKDYSLYGYVEYHCIQDWKGAGP